MADPATNTTAPGIWVPEPKQRGTFGIISLCLSTMIICTWSSPHLHSLTGHSTTRRRLLLRVSRTLLAFYAPELLLFLAMNELAGASTLLKRVPKAHRSPVKPGVFTRMYQYIRRLINWDYRLEERTSQPHFDLDYAFYAIMGGFAFNKPYDDIKEPRRDRERNTSDDWDVPRFGTLIYIMTYFPDIIINVQEHVTLDPVGSSLQTKVLLIIQVGWFCTNCASRLFQHLSLSLLEVSTAARAFCTLMTYLVWWSKPMNVAKPTILGGEEAEEVYALLNCDTEEYKEALAMAGKVGDSSASQGPHASAKIDQAANALRRLRRLPAETPDLPPEPRFRHRDSLLVPGSFSNEAPNKALLVSIAAVISPILYGSLHFLAWNNNFPTPLERLLWRVSSVVVTCSGLVGVSVLFFLMMLDRLSESRRGPHVFAGIMAIVIQAIHVVASGFLNIESLRQLAFLDSTAYEVPSWTNYWPHIS